MRSNELFERITQRIIARIEAGADEFVMPWHNWGKATGAPINAISGRPYRGVNVLLLWAAAELDGHASGCWATYRQWTAAGAQVRKGEKSAPIVFWKAATPQDSTELDPDGASRPRFVARIYHVFNAAQVDGAELPRPSTTNHADRIATADKFFSALGASIEHGGDRACYMPHLDKIHMPSLAQFRDFSSYYAVLGHEHVHWTGAPNRLERDLKSRFGTDSYAAEELIAELGSAFLCAHLGISAEPRSDHAAYVAAWLRVLRDDVRAIVTASAKAQEAVDFLVALADAGQGKAARDPEKLPQMAA